MTNLDLPHKPVLLDEVLTLFKDIKSGVIADATCGFAGHSEALLKAQGGVKILCNDRDEDALLFAKKRLLKFEGRAQFQHGRFSQLFETLKGVPLKAVLADIGVSSFQLDSDERGFGFASEELDMRMDSSQPFSAYDVVNGYCESELERIFFEYGEERFSKKIAKLIVEHRRKKKIDSAKELSDLISAVLKREKIHPATRVFQAIRIEVNDELSELEALLNGAKAARKSGIIVAIISFHSLEDRIVKDKFKEWARECTCPPEAYRCECGGKNALGEPINKKPITAGEAELRANPRSRSAKLRAFRFR